MRLDRSAFRTGFGLDDGLDESTFVEFKTGVGRDRIAEVVTAFSNTSGGNVLVGVTDDGEIKGRTSAAGLTVEDAIHQAITTVRNPGRYRIYEVDVEGRPVTVLAVEPRREGFTQTSDGRVLHRRGKRNISLFGAELATFVSRRLQQAYESTETPVPLSQADGRQVDALIDAYGWSPDTVENRLADRLTDLGLVYGDNEPCLTVAGGLLCLADPTQIVDKAYIEILRYRETTV